MKRNAFTAIFTITTMALSSFFTPCREQITESQIEGKNSWHRPCLHLQRSGWREDFCNRRDATRISRRDAGTYGIYENELRYPKRCRKAKIERLSFVRYTIEKDGILTGFEIIKSCGNKLLDKEAIRVIRRCLVGLQPHIAATLCLWNSFCRSGSGLMNTMTQNTMKKKQCMSQRRCPDGNPAFMKARKWM